MRARAKLLFAIACLACVSATAQAASITFGPYAVGPYAAGSGGSFGVPQFDPSLGTLIQVDLNVTGNSTGGSNGLQNISELAGNASVNIGTNITVTGPAALTVLTFPASSNSGPIAPYTGALDFTFSGPDSILVLGTPASDSNGDSITSGLGSYIGLGNVTFDFSSSVNTSSSADVSPTVSQTTPPTYDFSATVTYYYEPVPEPSTVVLGLFGLAGLAVAITRRRK